MLYTLWNRSHNFRNRNSLKRGNKRVIADEGVNTHITLQKCDLLLWHKSLKWCACTWLLSKSGVLAVVSINSFSAYVVIESVLWNILCFVLLKTLCRQLTLTFQPFELMRFNKRILPCSKCGPQRLVYFNCCRYFWYFAMITCTDCTIGDDHDWIYCRS